MPLAISRTSLVTQLVKNLPAMQETWVRSLAWEDSLEKGRATHSSILAWRIPCCLLPTRLLPPWNSPGKNTGVGCHFLLQGIFQPRDWTWVSHIAGRRFNLWVTREARTTVRGVAKSWIGLRTEWLSLSAISNP